VVALARIADRPLPPEPEGAAIDVAHLSRMTLGERSLEREVLRLFDRQAEMLLPRIRRGEPAVAAAAAHTLKGSANGIGAFRVARAAEAVEQAGDAAIAAAIDTLAAVLAEAKAEIARLTAR
jgi:HPt (histidine-containing phosphotransfer) domain-containing protein